MDPGLGELIRTRDGSSRAEAIVRSRDHAALPDCIDVVARFGEIATCRLRVDDIVRARRSRAVKSIKAPRYLTCAEISNPSRAEATVERMRRAGSGDGKDVVVAFLDFGFDFAHPNLRLADGSTRLLGLFDQQRSTQSGAENRYSYGRIHSRGDINRALQQDDPYRALSYQPADSDRGIGAHGTHTLDIAAGNGRAAGSLPGIAPACDLICVHLATSATSGLANLGDSVRLLEGLDFVRDTAGDRPWVANLSLGTTGGDHSGNSLVEHAMHALLEEAPGRAIVQSTGNYYQARTHTHGRLQPGRQVSLGWVIDKADVTPNELEVWYSGRDRFRAEIRDPAGSQTFVAELPGNTPIIIDDIEVGRIYHRDNEPQTGDHHIDIFLHRDAPPGKWQVTLVGKVVVDGRYHAWIERDAGRPENQSRFEANQATARYTTGSIANSYLPLVVGAFDAGSSDWQIAPFSSSGPTRDGRQKPDILAPGVAIRAARSTPRGEAPGSGGTTIMSGTSMAAPWVTGAIARLFSQAPRKLMISETRGIILGNTQEARGKNPLRSGSGYLDLQAIDKAARTTDWSAPVVADQLSSTHEVHAVLNPTDEDEGAYKGPPIGSQTAIFPRKRRTQQLLEERSDKKRNFILISGGPGPFDDQDVQHDVSWANYVTPPLLMTDTEKKRKNFAASDEEVWWFIYKPAYERRWTEDKGSSHRDRRKAAKKVEDQGFSSYTNKLADRAKKRGWKLRWLLRNDDLWDKMKTFKDPISRVWYWGHAADDLWLSLSHASDGTPEEPADHEVISRQSVRDHSGLKSKFEAGAFTRAHRFVGCNTADFAKVWAEIFGVWAEGVEGFVHFCSISQTGGEACLFKAGSSHAKIKYFSPTGTYDASKDANATTPKCDTPRELCKTDGVAEGVNEVLLPAVEGQAAIESTTVANGQLQDDTIEIGPSPSGALIELADDAVASGNGKAVDAALFEIVGTQLPTGLFDVSAPPQTAESSESDGLPIAVVARPGTAVTGALELGDVFVRRCPGGATHWAFLTDGHLIDHHQDSACAATFESRRPGLYAEVIEGGAFPHSVADKFARRLTDAAGRLVDDQWIIRLQPGLIDHVASQLDGVPIEEDASGAILSKIQGQLERRFRAGDAQGLQARRQRLVELFRSIPRASALGLYRRLSQPQQDDELARLFVRKLATATRNEMLCILLQTLHRLPVDTKLSSARSHRGITTKQACKVITIALRLLPKFRALARQKVITSEEAVEFGSWVKFLVDEAERLGRFQPVTPAQTRNLRERGKQLVADAKKLRRFPAFLRDRSRKTLNTGGNKLISDFQVSPSTIHVHKHEAARISFVIGEDIRSLSAYILEKEHEEGTAHRFFEWRKPKTRYQAAIWDGTFSYSRNKPPKTGTYRIRVDASDEQGRTDEVTAHIRVVNPHNKTVLPRTQSGLAPKALHFDGKHATLTDTGDNVIRVRAVSGLKPANPHNKKGVDFTQPRYQTVKDRGPIPEGHYVIRSGQVQDPDLIRGRLVYPTRGSARVWGPRRIQLHPQRVGDREGFFLHLDVAGDGTAGCIGVDPGDEGRFNQMTAIIAHGLKKGDELPVVVDYGQRQNEHTDSWLSGPQTEAADELSPEAQFPLFIRNLYIVMNDIWRKLPTETQNAVKAEVQRLYDFVGNTQNQNAITVIPLRPLLFPEVFDFGDAVVSVITYATGVHLSQAMRKQHKYAKKDIEALGIEVQGSFSGRFTSSPERVGQAVEQKLVLNPTSSNPLAIPFMAGAVNLNEITPMALDESKSRKRKIRERRKAAKAEKKCKEYLDSDQGKKDIEDLQVISNPKDPSKWPVTKQKRLGVLLGRSIAHEARHEFVSGHTNVGLGAESPNVFDDKNFSDFSIQDQNDIVQAIQSLETKQGNATVIKTYPISVRDIDDSFPF